MRKGFSLAEMLIVLLILGQISAFAIPKALNAQQNGQKRAVFKETYAALSEVWYTGFLSGELTEPTVSSYLRGRINHVKSCTDGVAQGCWSSSASLQWRDRTVLVLANGAVISVDDYVQGPDWVHGLVIDWNGLKGPNLVGDDQLVLTGNLGTYTDWSTRPGQIYHNTAFGNLAQYESLFAN